MKIEGLVTDVTAVGSPDIAEHAIFGGDFGWALFWPIQSIFCDWGAILWCRNHLLNPTNFTKGRLLKIKWLVANVIAVGSPDRAKHAILGVTLAGRCFDQFRPYLWSRSHFVI